MKAFGQFYNQHYKQLFRNSAALITMIDNYLEKQYKTFHRVYENKQTKHGIYIGDVASCQDMQFIKQHKITTVVTAATGMDYLKFDTGIRHIVYPLLDSKSENITKFFLHFSQIVDKQLLKGSILVHCFAGVSRSATLVIAYLMNKYQWGFKTAIEYVRRSRPSVCPNLGFERQLKEFQKFVKGNNKNSISQRSQVSKTRQSSHQNSRHAQRKILPQLNLQKPQLKKAVQPTVIGFPERQKKNTVSIDLELQQKQQMRRFLAGKPFLKVRSHSYGNKIQHAKRPIAKLRKVSNPNDDIKIAIISKLGLAGGLQSKFSTQKSLNNPRIAHQHFPMILKN